MKKYTYILYLTLISSSCNNKQENDINYIIDSNDLELIQSEKTKVSNEINTLEDELKKLNNAIIVLDKNQKFPLVTNSK